MLEPASSDVGVAAKALAAAGGNRPEARMIAKTTGASPRVLRFLEKALVGAATLNDGDFGEHLADWRTSSAAFFPSLRTVSVFFRGLDSGFRRVPLRARVGIVATNATAFLRNEGRPYATSRLTLTGEQSEPVTVGAILVMTDETAEHVSSEAQNLVNAELRQAVGAAVDTEFWDQVLDLSPPLSFTSSGTDAAAMRADLKTLLEAVNVTGAGPLIWAMSPDVGNAAALVDDPRGQMTPCGGELLGLPAMVSGVIPQGTLRLLNAAAIAGNADPIELDASREATLEMDDAPSQSAVVPTPSAMVNLFSTNSVALLGRVRFAARRLRDDAVAEVTGIAWGATSP